jgi:hypothetical protein
VVGQETGRGKRGSVARILVEEEVARGENLPRQRPVALKGLRSVGVQLGHATWREDESGGSPLDSGSEPARARGMRASVASDLNGGG